MIKLFFVLCIAVTVSAQTSRKDVPLPNADSLEYSIRNDYLLCTGDTTHISRERLFKWNNRMDSIMLSDKEYSKKFKTFASSTGIKAHEVRPCEPIVFFERLDKQMIEMDSIVSAARAKKERERRDSLIVAADMKNAKKHPADIFGIPGGVSKDALQAMLARSNIRSKPAQNFLRADSIMFDSVLVTVAFHFDTDNKYTGYEMETAALKAGELDNTVRPWAARLAAAFEKKLSAPPTAKHRVGFHDIKQGRMSITSRWDNDSDRPRTLIGLATHNNLYYAKVMVQYKRP